MLRPALLAIALLLPAPMYAQEMPAPSAPPDTAGTASAPRPPAPSALPCSDYLSHFPPCNLSKQQQKRARRLYDEALRLAGQHQLEDALAKMSEVREVSPLDAVYIEAQKAMAGQVAADNMKRGTKAMMRGDTKAAATSFQRTLELDPANDYARERLRGAEAPTAPLLPPVRSLLDDGTVRLRPAANVKSFNFRGGSAQFMAQFAQAYGISATQEDNFITRQVKINLENVTWEQALPIVARMCKALVIPMGEHEILLANDTEENRRDLTRMELRSFHPDGIGSPQELTDMSAALRLMFDLRFITLNASAGTLLVKAPQPTIDAIQRFLDSLDHSAPEVMLNISVFQVSTDLTKAMGLTAPTSFTAFNIPSEVNSALTSSSYQSIVAQLTALGLAVNSTTILAALLASGSSSSSLLTSPFATFGNGLTLTGVTMPSVSGKFNRTRSLTTTLENIALRSQHGNTATLKVGQRYPVVTTQYSTDTSTSSLLSSLGISTSSSTSTSTTTPTAQFQYEDLGLVLKTTPRVHGKLVSLEYEMTLRALGTTSVNGLPLMLNRDMKGAISTEDGESVVLAGALTTSEDATLNGIPILSLIPVLGRAFSVANHERQYDELLIVVTPHVISGASGADAYIPVPMNNPR